MRAADQLHLFVRVASEQTKKMAPEQIVYFKEGLPTPHLQPDWLATSVSSGIKIGCYFANVYRAAPWPKSGGFCVFQFWSREGRAARRAPPRDALISDGLLADGRLTIG